MAGFNKLFFYYLIVLVLMLAVFIFLLFTKTTEFGCLNLASCLVMKVSAVSFIEVENVETAPKASAKESDQTKDENKTLPTKKLAVYPESGTLILYGQSAEFSVSLFNNQGETIQVRFFLSENVVDTVEVLPNEKKVVLLKIHPYETRISWEIQDGDDQAGGFVEVLKMDQKHLLEAIHKKRKVMVLE